MPLRTEGAGDLNGSAGLEESFLWNRLREGLPTQGVRILFYSFELAVEHHARAGRIQPWRAEPAAAFSRLRATDPQATPGAGHASEQSCVQWNCSLWIVKWHFHKYRNEQVACAFSWIFF